MADMGILDVENPDGEKVGLVLLQGARHDKKGADGNLNVILMEHPGSLKVVPRAFDPFLEEAIGDYLHHWNVLSSD